MNARVGAYKFLKAGLAALSSAFLFTLIADNEFIKSSTYDKISKKYGDAARKRVVGLNDLMVKLKDASEAEKLGSPASHGCIRLSIADSKWLYDQLPTGTPIHIY